MNEDNIEKGVNPADDLKDTLVYQYNAISDAYSESTKKRLKTDLQYYAAKLLFLDGQAEEQSEKVLEGKKILDMGCGDGESARIAARLGAEVVAYDASEKQIEIATEKEGKEPLGIKYFSANRPTISLEEDFDMVSSIMVLPCAVDKNQLGEMFVDAYTHLKDKGKFVGETLNPDFNRYGEVVCNRKFTKKDPVPGVDEEYTNIDFVGDDGVVTLSITDTLFSRDDVEKAAKDAGFTKFEWVEMQIDPESLKRGEEFWTNYKKDPFYICFIAEK